MSTHTHTHAYKKRSKKRSKRLPNKRDIIFSKSIRVYLCYSITVISFDNSCVRAWFVRSIVPVLPPFSFPFFSSMVPSSSWFEYFFSQFFSQFRTIFYVLFFSCASIRLWYFVSWSFLWAQPKEPTKKKNTRIIISFHYIHIIFVANRLRRRMLRTRNDWVEKLIVFVSMERKTSARRRVISAAQRAMRRRSLHVMCASEQCKLLCSRCKMFKLDARVTCTGKGELQTKANIEIWQWMRTDEVARIEREMIQ